jgi:nicotinamidase-related amidase
MRALIIVDMLNDFVDGKLANPKAQAIVAAAAAATAPARRRVGGGVLERRPQAG